MNELAKIENDNFIVDETYVEKYKLLLELKEWFELADKDVRQRALDYMEATGKKNIVAGGLWFTYREGTIRTSLDTKKLKEDHPDIYEEYSKTSKVASSIVVKVLE